MASLGTQLASATGNAHSLQQATATLTQQLTAARAEVAQLSGEVATLQQQTQQDRQSSEAALKEELRQKDRSWKAAMQQAVATALADSSARDDALRKCLHAELEAAAQRERETLKRDSSAALSQHAAEWQSKMISLREEHLLTLASQAADLEAKHAEQAQQAAAEAQEDLVANMSKLRAAHDVTVAQQAQHATQQLAECKQRYTLACGLAGRHILGNTGPTCCNRVTTGCATCKHSLTEKSAV